MESTLYNTVKYNEVLSWIGSEGKWAVNDAGNELHTVGNCGD